MTDIDKQRIAAVQYLTDQGYRWSEGTWKGPFPSAMIDGVFKITMQTVVLSEADAMHSLLVLRADSLMGAPEESEGAAELEAISDTVERYERVRWPDGKIPGGKG